MTQDGSEHMQESPLTEPSFPPSPEIENMEVHHHAHSHGKKNAGAYFWEFMMLFLAVFCGFLAEYQLEHVIEHQREKKLMTTLTEDLEADDATLLKYSGWRNGVNQEFDSLLYFLSSPDPDQFAHSIYKKTAGNALRFGLPDINEGTIQQLKNAGGLRLVRKKEVVNAINKHYLMAGRMRAAYETEKLLRVKLVESSSDVLDARMSMNLEHPSDSYRLITKEKAPINRFMNQLIAARIVNKGLMITLDSTRESGIRLKGLIEKEYELK